jgi:type II secretory pathway component PulF
MPTFAYQATDTTGRDQSGTVEAPDRTSALRQLTGRGLQPFAVAESNTGKSAKAIATAAANSATKAKNKIEDASGPIRIGATNLQLFTEELSELLEAGMRLEPALKLMEGRDEKATHRPIARRLGNMIREGHSFSHALRQSSPSFSELYCAVAAAGEAGGSLGIALRRQSQYLSSVREMRGKVAVALIYPGFLLVSAIGVAIMFATFLIPKLTNVIANMKGGMPKGIRIILATTDFFKTWWWLMLALAVLAALGAWVWSRSPKGRPVWDQQKLKIPFIGGVLMASFHSQFLETLASLSSGGLPLLRGLELASKVSSNVFIQGQLAKVTDLVRDGAPMSRALERTALFPQNMIEMVRIGEHTGDIAGSLRRTADRCGRELSKSLDKAMAMVQPVIILIMAALVGTMAYVMISVISQTVSSIRR